MIGDVELMPVGHGRTIDTGRALTIRWPWFSAIAVHGRRVEVRKRPCPAWAIGRRLWLHCAKGSGPADRADAELLARAGLVDQPARAWRGCIAARARVVGCIEAQRVGGVYVASGPRARGALRWLGGELLPARFAPDVAYLWLLEDVETLSPLPTRGQLGLWRVPADLHSEALRRASSARAEAALRAIEAIGEEIGPVRRRSTSYVVGRWPGLVVQADPARMYVEAMEGHRLCRVPDVPSAAGFVSALQRAIATVRGVRKESGTPGQMRGATP